MNDNNAVKIAWDLWCETYPIRTVSSIPIYYWEGPIADRVDAEAIKDNLEIAEKRGGFEIVEYCSMFYIITE